MAEEVQLDAALQTQEDAINEEFAARKLADRLGLEYVDLEQFEIDPELFRSIPVDLMFRYNFVPRHRTETGLVVVVADPADVLMIDELELLLGTGITVSVGTSSAIQEILKKSESSQRVLEEATEGFRLQIITEDADTGEETLSIDKMTEGSSPIIKLVDSTIFNALQRRASDMHFETRDKQVVIKYRIDGVLYQAMEPIDKKFHSPIISRLKVMSELDISEKRIPQDGRFKLRIKGRTIDFRVSIVPTAHGEDCVIRVLDKESTSQEFSSLSLEVCGFEEKDKARLRRFIKEPYGMVLVTGPTGSGKTTTLYAALAEITNEEDKIITIEDPVEYQMPGITQIPVNEKKGLTFSKGLRAILRHDPDKVMVGEIRDPETAAIAIQSALTGHLVFTTVHANNVVDVVGRFLNMNVEPYNFVSALNCILAQRLVRLICEHCKQKVQATPQLLMESGLDVHRFRDWTFYEGRGCIDCNGTGYRGRTAIAELLNMSDRIREMILQRKPGSDIKRAAKEEGMTFLREAALSKAFAGKTTLYEINKVTFVD
ncbi:MAG: ATPase, T2SS/T4P/T4SS family [Acidobacteriota bacterium]|nr:ATPase, T2SS/T4P/T4SS family [Acidobacteriota bacterium]MDH3783857.1 ATPase, T2SS/T4P/T4SS family [Acidobacteriota bacterium]